MKRNAIYTLIACLFLAACSSEEEWMISDDQTPAIELGRATQFTDYGFHSRRNPLCQPDRVKNRESDVQPMVIAL